MAIANRKLQVLVALSMMLVMVLIAGGVSAGKPAKPCTGTYLVVVSGPDPQYFNSTAMWTLSDDGTFQGTDSAEDAIDPDFPTNTGFSHQQGAWSVTATGTHVTALDFARDATQDAPSTARVDADLTFGAGCMDLTGTLDLRIYFTGLDPLDIDQAAYQPGDNIPFTGRLMTAP